MTAAAPGRVLVVKLGDLGDCILLTPALRALRVALPTTRIDLLAPPIAAEVIGRSKIVDLHIALPKARLERAAQSGPLGLARLLAFGAMLRRGRYDVVVLAQHLTTGPGIVKLAALALATGAPRRLGLDNGRGWFLTDREPDDGFSSRHEAEHWRALVAHIGADRLPRRPEVAIEPSDVSNALELLAGLPRPIVALHPGSGPYSIARRWPVERFIALGSSLVRERGASLVVVGNEPALNGRLAEATGARDLSRRTSVGTLAAVLARVDLLVTNDSGVLHVGAAVAAPLVAIFGQTDPRAWGPYFGDPALAERAAIVDVPLPCRPCLYRRHELGWRDGCSTRDCFDLISPGMVRAAVERQLRHGPAVADAAPTPR